MVAGDPAAKREPINRAYTRLLDITRKLPNRFPEVGDGEETAGVLNEAYLRLHAALDEVRPASVRPFLRLGSRRSGCPG